MYERSHIEQLIKRINECRKLIQVVMGPRQVGKTTMLTQILKKTKIKYSFESADAVLNSNSVWLHQVWEGARMAMKTAGAREYLLVIDEIQKIENWSEVVKLNWDNDTRNGLNIKVVLLGSSRLLIQKGLTESLAGRFETFQLGHWSFAEMQAAFGWNLEQYIYFGGYPGSASFIKDEERWKNYVRDSLIETSISKDILMLTRVNKPALLKRLFEIGTLYSGKILSYTKLMGELQDAGNTTTLSHYLQLLSDCCLLGGLEKYSSNIIRKRSSSPKFHVYNNALLSALGNHNFAEVRVNPAAWGHIAESSVGAHLLNYAAPERYNVYYWREGNLEVDFVLEHNGRIVAIEVKSGRRAESKGMSEFAKKFSPKKVFLVGTGGIPFDVFLKINPKELF